MNSQHNALKSLLLIVLMILFFTNISFGAIYIPLKDVFSSLFGGHSSKDTWQYIVINYRLPKAIVAVLVGMGLSTAGLLMQTLFRNPLAGPDVLGLSSGSSLGVAIIVLGSNFSPLFMNGMLLSAYSLVLASCLGSFCVLLLVLFVSQKLRNTNSILIVGIMFGSFAGAIVGVLTYFTTAEQLQKFTFWSMGNLGSLSWTSIMILTTATVLGLCLSLSCIKSLNAMLLGENYAKSLGLNYTKFRFVILIATSILTGSITAFVGPIAFVGLAVPHLAKIVFKTSNHYILFWTTLVLGAITMLFCDIMSHIPGTEIILPINAITSIIGAPVVVWLILKPSKAYRSN